MNVKNIEIELGLVSYQLKHKRFLDAEGGTSLEEFQRSLRDAIQYQVLEKAPYGTALNPKQRRAEFSLKAQRPYGSRTASLDFVFSLHTETLSLSLQKMTMILSSNPTNPLVWEKSSGEKLPSSDKAFQLIEGKKFQDKKPNPGRQIRGGHQSNNRKM